MSKPKAGKKDPNAPVYVFEDAFSRMRCITSQKIQVKPVKGDLSVENLSLPPIIQQLPELKHTVNYYKNGAIMRYSDSATDLREPTLFKRLSKPDTDPLRRVASTGSLKQVPRKEVMDLVKAAKAEVKRADKASAVFFKSFEKNEAKQFKRQALQDKMNELKEQMTADLKEARRLADETQVFIPKYMTGSKLGVHENLPKHNVAIVLELSEESAEWLDEMKEEIVKFIPTAIDKRVESFNLMLFTNSGVTQWMSTYTPTFAKKGSADALKWLQKNYNPKVALSQQWPPNYAELMTTLLGGDVLPSVVYLLATRAPTPSTDVLNQIRTARIESDTDIPFFCITFDPETKNDMNQQDFWEVLIGSQGSWTVDSTKKDMQAIDRLLASAKQKKSQIDKTQKQFDKIEDLTEKLEEDRKLLHYQLSLQSMVANDLELLDLGTRTEFHPDDVPLPI